MRRNPKTSYASKGASTAKRSSYVQSKRADSRSSRTSNYRSAPASTPAYMSAKVS